MKRTFLRLEDPVNPTPRDQSSLLGGLDFSKVVYYPAGGTDLQAILRFSRVADTILSPTVSEYLTREKYEALFRLKCATLNAHFGETLLELSEVEDLDASFIRSRRFVEAPAGLFTEPEKREYMAAFRHYMALDPKVYRFRFLRWTGGTARPIDWIAMGTEGLATLVAIKLATGATPRIVCTLQSGVLEHPESLFVRMVERTDIRPDIWVRGAWACLDPKRQSIQPFPPFAVAVQDYGCWNSGLGVPPESNEDTHCVPPISWARAFARDNRIADALPEQVTLAHPGNAQRVIRLKRADLVATAGEYDRIFCGRSILPAGGERIVHWEDLAPRLHTAAFPDLTLREALRSVRARSAPGSRIAMTPMGYEDESAALREFLMASDEAMDLTVVHRRALDFWDLKQHG